MVNIPRWQIILVLVVLSAGLVFAAPNLLGKDSAEALPDWLPKQQINLGLDLRGGSYLLLEADIESVMEEQFDDLLDSLRREYRREKIPVTSLAAEDEALVVRLGDPATVDDARTIVRNLTQDFDIATEEGGVLRLTLGDLAMRDRLTQIMAQTVEIIGRRVNGLGVSEATIQRQGDRRVLVQVPGLKEPERVKELIGTTAKLNFQFVREGAVAGTGSAPPGTRILPSSEKDAQGGPLTRYVVERRVMVSGENLVDAQSTFQDNQPVVSFRFDTTGGRRFARATQDNVGRVFAIVLDNEVISAPVIREPILGGSGVISGRFTVQETQDLALLLRAGALPAPLNILEERTVGAGLGEDSIRAGTIACILGLIFVILFMAGSYGLFGMAADVALLVNLVLIAAVLSALQATLTLPGIAGIVLTIGMAVDANVLIFERIREEMALGRGPVTAIDVGYRRAMTTILDSNITTLIAATLLFSFGSGPVKGFAVTLGIGIASSMFTAIMLTRLLVVAWLRRRRPQALPI